MDPKTVKEFFLKSLLELGTRSKKFIFDFGIFDTAKIPYKKIYDFSKKLNISAQSYEK